MTSHSLETIAAIATPPGRGGIGVVRVSGPRAREVALGITGKALQPRYATYGNFRDAEGGLIDQGIALLFVAPHSFTGEDVLELQGHGGDAVMQLLLQRCRELGCRLAEPGEFTRRAFLNDKLDLAQAEAVADLIDAESTQAARSAARSLAGEFSARARELADALIALRSFVEAALDFPEEDIEFLRSHDVAGKLAQLQARVEAVLATARQGALLRSGIRVVILGQPNVGKSSLLNRLAGEELAIVTAVPGTTRDPVRERIQIEGVPLHIIDTAGLREAGDEVERIGIDRSWQAAGEADILVLMLDATRGFTAVDQAIVDRLPAGVKRIHAYNKLDLLPAHGGPRLDRTDTTISVWMSIRSDLGVPLLQQAVLELAGWRPGNEHVVMARTRHVVALTQARAHIVEAARRLDQPELLAEELRQAQMMIGSITGEFSADDLLGEIFGRFCIGK